MDDPTKEFRRLKELKELERLNGSGPAPHELKSSGLMTGLATLFVIGLALIVGMTLAADWQPEAGEDFYPTPIATSAWHVTRDLQPTPTLMPTQPPELYALPTAVPTNTPVPTWTMAPTQTPYPTLTTAPTWTPAATWTTQATHTAAPTYTPYPTATAVPATATPTPIPATATAAPTLLPPILPPAGGPEVVVVGGGYDLLFYVLFAIDVGLFLFIAYMMFSTRKQRRRPPLTTPLPPLPIPTGGKKVTGRPSPLQARRVVESSESSRRVEPVEPVELEPVQEVQLPFSKDRPPLPEERAYIRRRYAETGNLTAVCMEVYNSKGGKVWAWMKEAVEERPAVGRGQADDRPQPKRPKRPFFVNTNRGRMEV
jgi:hypothetical protein